MNSSGEPLFYVLDPRHFEDCRGSREQAVGVVVERPLRSLAAQVIVFEEQPIDVPAAVREWHFGTRYVSTNVDGLGDPRAD